MAEMEDADGGGCISDESDFYGDDNVRERFEEKARRRLEPGFQAPVPGAAGKRVRLSPLSWTPSVAKKHEQQEEQSAKLQRAQANALKPAKHDEPRCVRGKDATRPDLVDVNLFRNHQAAWQQDETVESFLRRLPVDSPTTPTVDGWLWVGSTTIPYKHKKQQAKEDRTAFTIGGLDLLESFETQQAKIESENQGKAQSTIARKLSPYREQLENDLLSLAVKTHATGGKWMLFPNQADLPRYWRLVAEATAEGRLGPMSKSATLSPGKNETLICVYTYDFTDNRETRRVLHELVDLGLCFADERPIYYKCEAYTHLGLSSGNEYKLRASLYSSKEILHDEAKAFKDGPVNRIREKCTKTMEEFFSVIADDGDV